MHTDLREQKRKRRTMGSLRVFRLIEWEGETSPLSISHKTEPEPQKRQESTRCEGECKLRDPK